VHDATHCTHHYRPQDADKDTADDSVNPLDGSVDAAINEKSWQHQPSGDKDNPSNDSHSFTRGLCAVPFSAI
jgi:hypothetical protein